MARLFETLDRETSGAGSPPPNEMISGLCVTFKSSRMAELLIPSVRCAYRDFQSVDMGSPQDCQLLDANHRRFQRFQSFKVSKSRSTPRFSGFTLKL
jgi:hypothetical protein